METQPSTVRSRVFNILAVDDDEDARALLKMVLEFGDIKVTFAQDGQEAIEKCEQRMPDLALLDVRLPRVSGTEVCQWIKENSGKNFIPVILVTGNTEVHQKVDGLNCGADDYITKPFHRSELKARVRALLRTKVLTDQLKETRNLLAQKERELVAMQVAGGASHKLGQPLTSILLYCEMLSKLPQGGEQYEKTLREIKSQCVNVREILDSINRMQDFKTTDYAGGLEICEFD